MTIRFRRRSPTFWQVLRARNALFLRRLQEYLERALASDILLLHNPARRANFGVLRSSETPSVLVEMGFMSNKADELLLQSDHHRASVVAALKIGLEVLHTTDHDVLSAAIAAAPPRWMWGRLSAKRPRHWG
ncbi:N-acetylmuramoyl-L-alanine amidase [Bradyrhizobium sp. CCGUVB23]|uniref:N-acetylmuramoyl-L-alanine amidase n=1 Tax=Bradyrhizobium sp. CCGUVB23 TaxID=2949630 RepID=UPI0020B2EE6E|nr:N-acetylmuramoyl-L-alanine amidase [Bradyrhizobium sp. CCGUVB23]MCP3460326.1 N-acetylmuramoyl-L-alanine amidase [Bradyrhizobium sp. CCGUVB23]